MTSATAFAALWAVVFVVASHAAAPILVVDVARIEGYEVAQGDPWSPRNSFLALENGSQLAIWDASRPTSPPRVLLTAKIDEVRWSPDGTWLCCRVHVANATRGGAVRLQFVALEGGANEYRIPNAAIGPWTWAGDGFVYFWNGKTGERKRVDPPRAWRERFTPPTWSAAEAAAQAQLLLRPTTERGRRTRTVLFTPPSAGGEATDTVLDSVTASGGVQPWCRFRPAGSDAPLWIVGFQERGGAVATYTVDATGRKRALVERGTTFTDLSVSGDGRWAWVAACTRPRDGSAPACTTRAIATDGSASYAVPQLQGAVRIQQDPASNLIAAGINAPRAVRIVRLDAGAGASSSRQTP